jgi:KipI family sensor histidine kinase inhibitor
LSPEADAGLRLRPVGDTALCAELGDRIDPVVNGRVRALDRALQERPFPGFLESVPTHRSLLVCFEPGRASVEDAAAAVRELEARTAAREEPSRLHEIAVRYGGEDGPDLEAVAARAGLTPEGVVSLHCGREYTAFMLGFLPGFAYLGLLPEALDTPRLETPRPRVAAGSLGIAGRLTAVYPAASPGGWNLIGRAGARLFDPEKDPPALLAPGDRVRFRPVERIEEPTCGPKALPAPANPAFEVLAPGLLTTVQAAPRLGYRRFGVPGAGPLDAPAQALANRAVGNEPGAAALECTVVGPTLRFLKTTRFAVAGSDLGARLERADLGAWPVPLGAAVLARPGNVLSFDGRRSGCRAYVAFAGGIDLPLVLGSRSTDLSGGFGGWLGRALCKADAFALLPPRPDAGRPGEAGAEMEIADEVTVRVVLGPQDDHFASEAVERLLSSAFTLRETSDRVGCRLQGPLLAHVRSPEIASDGMVPGSIQVPPDGQPIVMLADGPTTGGYPKIATVVSRDLPRLARLLPGAGRLRFQRAPLPGESAS